MRLRNIPGAKDAIAESIYVIQNPQENKGNWDKVFPQNQPVHLEVGMGKGRFLMDMAKLHPEINYIGIEIDVYKRQFQSVLQFVTLMDYHAFHTCQSHPCAGIDVVTDQKHFHNYNLPMIMKEMIRP